MPDATRPTHLARLLEQDSEALEYYTSLHPCVRGHMEEYAQEILSMEDLTRISNVLMSEELSDLGAIYQDNDL